VGKGKAGVRVGMAVLLGVDVAVGVIEAVEEGSGVKVG